MNNLNDLNDILFAELQNLQQPNNTGDQQERIARAMAVSKVAETIVKNADIALRAMQHENEYGYGERSSKLLAPVPKALKVGEKQ